MGKVCSLFHLFKFVGFLFTCIIIVGKEEHPLAGLLDMEKHKTREEVYTWHIVGSCNSFPRNTIEMLNVANVTNYVCMYTADAV